MVLLEAERAHTSSLALQQTYLSSPVATRHTSTLHNSNTRSSKSLLHASNLLSLLLSLPSTTATSPRSLGQAKIYHLVLKAGLAFKKEDFESALSAYIVARTLLSQLAEGEDTPRGEALALGWMDEEVDPRIRFCAYKLGRKDSHDVEGIAAEFAGDELAELLAEYQAVEVLQVLEGWAVEQGRDDKKKSGKKIVWLEKEVEFRNADVVVVMEKVEKALAKLEGATGAGGKKMRAYDRVLGELGEAFEKVKRIRTEGQVTTTLLSFLFLSLRSLLTCCRRLLPGLFLHLLHPQSLPVRLPLSPPGLPPPCPPLEPNRARSPPRQVTPPTRQAHRPRGVCCLVLFVSRSSACASVCNQALRRHHQGLGGHPRARSRRSGRRGLGGCRGQNWLLQGKEVSLGHQHFPTVSP